ncbi:MAG: methyltransferase domain-containing protein [Nocardioides sp.]|nr:methyltransferase domain-containing protein [Nocardioides sp.]
MPKLPVPDVLLRTLSRQLGGPSGALGVVVARMLNKGNRPTITAAAGALELTGSEEVADIGFGGGLGLELLLDATRDGGRVHGVDPSPDMLTRARKAHHEEVAAGRLALHEAGMEALPIADGALDGWISLNTVYFVEDLSPALAELRRVLASAGRGVLGVADPDWMAQRAFTKHNFTLRPVPDVVAALTATGFSVERRTMEGSPPFNLLVCRPVPA